MTGGAAPTPPPRRPPRSDDSTGHCRFAVRGLEVASHGPRTVPLHFPRLADVLDRTGRTGPEPAPTRPHAGGPVGNRRRVAALADAGRARRRDRDRSEEHTSELQSLMRISYAVFCLKKKNKQRQIQNTTKLLKTTHKR